MSPPLSENFPDDIKETAAKAKLMPGTVLRAKVQDTNPPKEKIFVIVGINSDSTILATVYINSEINPNIFKSDKLKSLHHRLSKTGRSYLDHDSFIDCSKVVQKNLEEVKNLIVSNPLVVVGVLSTTDLLMVTSAIQNAFTIDERIKRKFGLNNS